MRQKKEQSINLVVFCRLWVGVKCFIGSTDGSLAIAPPAPGQSLSAPVLLLAHNVPPTNTTTSNSPAKKSKKCYSGNWQKAQNCSA